MYVTSFIQGFGTSAGLIVAIGAQNAFVLSQSVRRNHHLLIALVCILCDVIFISIGVAGVGSAIAAHPSLSRLLTWAGAGFLVIYGFGSLRSAIRGGSLGTGEEHRASRRGIISATLAVTLLNPHFYLDTVLLLGGISGGFAGDLRLLFWLGAISASAVWFLGLSLGAERLAPLFRTRTAWRVLDLVICVTMWTIAVSLFS